MRIAASELIIRPDGAIYHLGITPEQMCDNIILVGDPDRVPKVSAHFSSIDYRSQNREIVIHKGKYHDKDLMVVSTGMGTDNIDIVLNELDALVNIDFKTREVKKDLTMLNLVRIGTSGSIQQEIEIGSYVIAEYGIGMDGLLSYYQSDWVREKPVEDALVQAFHLENSGIQPYVVKSSQLLFNLFKTESFIPGVTCTFNGFYGPQGRVLRLPLSLPNLNKDLESFNYNGLKISNIEMETAGIYGLAALMGHQALSCNLILANRVDGTFIEDYSEPMNNMIQSVLNLF